MVALPLFDIVLASGQDLNRSAKVAAQLTHSALGDLDEIEALDNSLVPDDPDRFDRSTASLLRGMYERWADETERLLERIDRLEQAAKLSVPGSDALRHAHGRTRARLSVSLDDMEQGVHEARDGHTIPLEEIRRDLRLRVHETGHGSIPTTRPVAGGGNA